MHFNTSCMLKVEYTLPKTKSVANLWFLNDALFYLGDGHRLHKLFQRLTQLRSEFKSSPVFAKITSNFNLHAIVDRLTHSGKRHMTDVTEYEAGNLVSTTSQLLTGFTRRWLPTCVGDFSLGNVFTTERMKRLIERSQWIMIHGDSRGVSHRFYKT